MYRKKEALKNKPHRMGLWRLAEQMNFVLPPSIIEQLWTRREYEEYQAYVSIRNDERDN